MKKLLGVAVLCIVLLGCGEDKPSDKVMKFIATQDIGMLSKSKTSMCTDAGLKKIHFIDENVLPTTNEYYQVSKYLYSKSKYSFVSERKEGDVYIVAVKWIYPKAIREAKSFMWAEIPHIDDREKKNLDNIKSLYENGSLKDLEYEEEVANWTVLNDGIDPKLSESAIKVCSES